MMIVTDYDRSFCDQTTGYALRYFCEVSAPVLVNYSTRSFWNEYVLQACYAEPCVKDLVIATVCLERSLGKCGSRALPTVAQAEFGKHYGRALKQLSHHHDAGVVLIGCLLLVLCEDLLKNPYGAIMHINAGRKLLAERYHKIDRHLSRDMEVIFKELVLHSPELTSDIVRIQCIFRGVSGVSPKVLYSLDNSCLDGGFTSMEHAMSDLEHLRPLCIAKLGAPRPLTRFHVVSGVTDKLNAWLRRFNSFTASMDDDQQMCQRMVIHGIRAYHLVLNISSRCTTFDDESLFDLYSHDLEGLVKKLSILSDCGAPNIVTLLFFIACKFRDVAARRRAICLLRYEANGAEGNFLANIAEQIVQAEEDGLADPVTCEDIPPSARIRPQPTMAGQDEWGKTVSQSYLRLVLILTVHVQILQRAIDLHIHL